MRVQAESDGTYYAAKIVAVSTSKNRAKAPVKVSYNGYDGYDEWLGGDRLRSKSLKLAAPPKEGPAREAPHMTYFPIAGRGELIRLIAAKKHAGYDFSKFPKVMALCERTAKADGVAAYMASSTFTV